LRPDGFRGGEAIELRIEEVSALEPLARVQEPQVLASSYLP
jgi:hypothetical protein